MNRKDFPNWIVGYRSKRIPTVVGIVFTLFMVFLLFSKSTPLSYWLEFIENKTYDFQVRETYEPLSSHPDVVIVGLDNASLKAEGRLPWSRDKMAALVDRLKEFGAKVVALDFLFPTEEPNIALKVFQSLQEKGNPIENENVAKDFDFDALLAQSLSSVDSVLGMAFTWDEESTGVLPAPILTLTPQTESIYIPEKNSYLGNIPLLQKAAKGGGFINSTPDADAVIRFSPLIYRLGSEVFGSLAVVAVNEYLNVKRVDLVSKPYGAMNFLEAIQLDQRRIPVDPMGRILVPYRGPAFSFPHLSATDVLHNRIPPDAVRDKLVFVGTTATGSGDLVSTPLSQSYDGVEIYASIAQSIIDRYFPYKPGWEKGISVAMVLLLGLFLAFLLPLLGPLQKMFTAGGCIGFLFLLSYWAWGHDRIVLSVFLPILVIGLLALFNIIYGYVVEAKQRQIIKSVFGQYISAEYIDFILKKGIEIELRGESKELTVLFADIRGFTTLLEKMKATEITSFLNAYFTAMTEVIFAQRGTIDKYIGDAIMAFWGAPLDDATHAHHAVLAALEMQRRLEEFDEQLVAQQKPTIHIGIGVGTWPMYVGDMGSKFRRSYTVMGDTVNLCSRIEELTKRYGVKIIVTENTYLATKDRIVYRKLDKVQVKGKELAVVIFEPICTVETLPPRMKEEIDLHSQALEAYTQGDWTHAGQIWKQLQETGQNRKLYGMYLERMAASPPPGPDWNGVQKYETK